MKNYYNRFLFIFLVLICSGCSIIGYNKVGAEFVIENESIIKSPTFKTEELTDVTNGEYYVDLEKLKYKHPVSGEWEGIAKLARGDDDEELVFFMVIATYNKPIDLPFIIELFKYPLKLNKSNVKSNKHDWFTENFDLANLPEGANAQYWLGFNGKVKPSIEDNINFGTFKAKGKSVHNGTRLWPLKIDVAKYVYMKVFVLEETGHKRLRKIWKKAGGDSDLDLELVFGLIKHGVNQDYLGVATLVGGFAASTFIEHKIDKDGLIDLEYAYESDSKICAAKIPLFHKRLWTDNPTEETSFEFKLSLTKNRRIPIGEIPLSIDGNVMIFNFK